MQDETDFSYSLTQTTPENKWVHYVVRQILVRKWDNAELHVYVNGKRDYTNSDDVTLKTADMEIVDNLDAKFIVGKNFKGLIDNIRIYNYALDRDQIVSLYTEETKIKESYDFEYWYNLRSSSLFGSSYINIKAELDTSDAIGFGG